MIKNYFTSFDIKLSFLLFIFLFSFQSQNAQELYVGSGAEFFLKANTDFTTSNTIVSMDTSGKFTLESGSNWGSDTEYVNGEVTVVGNGETKLPIGNNGVYAPVIAKHSSDVVGSYFNSTPSSGTNGVDVDAVANVEYWKLSGTAIITLPWNQNSNITDLVTNNGGSLNSVAIVGLDNGFWNLVSATQTNTVTGDLLNGTVKSDVNIEVDLNSSSEFTFGIDHQVALAVNDLFLSTGINILSNPIRSNENFIRFKSENDLNKLKVTLYDITGKRLKVYQNINTKSGYGNLIKPNLKTGLYFLKFDHEGKQGVKKIIIE